MLIKCEQCGHEQNVEMSSGPRPGSVTHAVYEWVQSHPTGTRAQALEWAGVMGFNPLTVLTQYAAAKRALKK